MPAKISKNLVDQIIRRTAASQNADDIIMDVCKETNLNWNDSENLVNQVVAENKNKITLTQSPLLILLSLFIFLGGVAVIGYDVFQIYFMYSISHVAFYSYLLVNLQSFIPTIVLGLAMIVGSLKGMQEIWSAIFAWLGVGEE